MKIVQLTITLFLCYSTTFAFQIQEWGVVTQNEWNSDYFPDDDEKHSVILFDFGDSFIDQNLNVIHTRHKRIKILDPENSVYSDMRIRVYKDRDVQLLRRLEAQTLNKAPDGEITVTELGRGDFYSETSGDWEINSFAFPALEQGSIVEYKYTMRYGNPIYMPDWDFQHGSPIVHSEYRVMVPDYLNYRVYYYGYEKFEDSDEYTQEVSRQMRRNVMAASGRSQNSIYHLVLKDGPAIRQEPFITSLANYRNKVKFQLTGYTDAYGVERSYLSTWDEIAEQLNDLSRFGRELNSRRSIRSVVNEITDGLDSDYEKAKAIYNFVASDIKWDGRFRVIATDRLTNILDNKTGTSADKSLLLINMLRTAGFESHPVVISTRDNGKVDWTFASVNAFNHVLTLVNLNDVLYMLDPLDDIIPFGVLSPSSLNQSGLLIEDGQAKVIDIVPQINSSSQTSVLTEINEKGGIKSEINIRFGGYEAIIQRKSAEGDGEDLYLERTILEYLPDSRIVSSDILKLDNPDEPFAVQVTFENDRYASMAGDMIYINPFLFDRITENPFTNPTRAFPVEFNFGIQKRHVTTISVPETFEIVEVPEYRIHQFSDNTTFRLIGQIVNNDIQLLMTMTFGDNEIGSEYYDELRSYYSALANVFNEQIVLKRKSDSPLSVYENDENTDTDSQ
jgi:transglutaminase-like putative cysteine protease